MEKLISVTVTAEKIQKNTVYDRPKPGKVPAQKHTQQNIV